MKKIYLLWGLPLLFCFQLLAANDALQILPMSPGEQPEYVKLQLIFPQTGAVIGDDQNYIQVRLKGFSLGSVSSDLPRKDEVANSGVQSLHVIIDNEPYFIYDGVSLDPLEDNEDFQESVFKFNIPVSLKEGVHTIRMFPARSFGEGLKMKDNFVATYFFYKKPGKIPAVFQKPFLTYNEPTGTIHPTDREPVLLDFFVNNVELSSDGYKVMLSIDQQTNRMLTREVPYYIYGLSKGYHEIALSLVDRDGNLVNGSFNQVKRLIRIE